MTATTCGQKRRLTVHQGLVEFELGVHGMREEVGVDEYRVGGPEGGVGLEEEGGGRLRTGRRRVRCAIGCGEGRWVYISRLACSAAARFCDSSPPLSWFFCLGRGLDGIGEVDGGRGVQSGVALADDALHLRKLARPLLYTHGWSRCARVCRYV